MNQYAICREVLSAGGLTTIGALIERTGLTERNLTLQLSALCGQGILARDHDRVLTKNKVKAAEYARIASVDDHRTATLTPLADRVVPPADRVVPRSPLAQDKPQRVKIELPKGLSIMDAVPIPERRIGCIQRPIVLPFASMKVGQCVLVPIPDGIASTEMANRVRAEVEAYRRRIDESFAATVRATVFPENHPQFGEHCIGVWKVTAAQAAANNQRKPAKKLKAVK